MPNPLKRLFRRNSRNSVFKGLAKLGLSINRYYENKNYDQLSNGELTVLQRLASISPKCIFDVGANVGNYATLVHRLYPHAEIHAFEPIEKPYLEMEKTVRLIKKIHPHPFALSCSTGLQTLYRYDESVHTSPVNIQGMGRQVKERIETKGMKGDDFMIDNQVDFIDLLKIDVEGGEMDVIKGFEKAFETKKIKVCQFEYGYANITTHQLLIDYHQFFNTMGYLVGKIYPKKVEFRSYDVRQEDFLGPNFLAVDENDKELIKILGR